MILAELKPGDQLVDCTVLIASSEVKTAKSGSTYLALHLQDKSGLLEARVFKWSDAAPIPPATFAAIDGKVDEYRGNRQIIIDSYSILGDQSAINIADFRPTSRYDPDRMMDRLNTIISLHCTDPIRGVLHAALAKYGDKFKFAPAAMVYHHGYVSGLLEHSLSLAEASVKLCEHYKQLDVQIMIAASLLHDIGKVHELENELAIRYTRAGQLLGHIPIGLIGTSALMSKLDPLLREKIQHCILSHHGALEYGSPVEPKTLEALAFSALDKLDAGIAAVMNAAEGPLDADGFTARVPSMGRSFYVGVKC